MTDELTRAAEEASKATGRKLECVTSDDTNDRGEHYLVIALDGVPLVAHRAGPIWQRRALAYLEGLAQGAHTANVRHEPVVSAATECLPDLERHASTHGPGPDTRRDQLVVALAELGGE
uniref:Uncharacterized protein n=1 Tax=viral metagenome TaxID=1070528 RepID=A0A6M3L8Q1_9ZZZZ